MKKVTAFTIDRAKWGKGALLNEDGSMCCLGFFSKACGISDKQMGPWGLPLSKWKSVPAWAHDGDNATDAPELICWNDNGHALGKKSRRSGVEVEAAITRIFAKHGVKVTFKGKKAPRKAASV